MPTEWVSSSQQIVEHLHLTLTLAVDINKAILQSSEHVGLQAITSTRNTGCMLKQRTTFPHFLKKVFVHHSRVFIIFWSPDLAPSTDLFSTSHSYAYRLLTIAQLNYTTVMRHTSLYRKAVNVNMCSMCLERIMLLCRLNSSR